MSELLVRTYGMGEFTAQVFNAVALTVDHPGFKVVLSGAFLISMVVAIYQFTKVKDISILAKNIFLYIGVVSLLIIPKYKVTIHDDVVGNNYGVANVPMGLAAPAYLITNTFYGLTSIVETMFHWPNDQSYAKTGFLFASSVVRNSTQFKLNSPEVNSSLNSFLSQCVFYDIYLGRYTLDELLKSNDMWEIIKSNSAKNRAFMLDNEVTMCNEGVKVLDAKINKTLDSTFSSYAKIIFPGTSSTNYDNKILVGKLLTSVGSSYSYLTGVSKGGFEILKQNILVNAVQDAALNNSELGMYSYAVTRANAQKVVANTTTGIMMARWLPVMTGATETMIYALFILVVIYALFTNGEKVFFNYVMTMVWVGSWPVVYAILNFGFTWAIRLKSHGSGLSFYDSNYLSQTQYDMSSLFGYFTILVPYISWGMMNLAKQGLGSVFTQMSQLVGSSTQSLSMASSGEAVTGNMQFGNTSFNNHSMFNDSGFKHDTNLGYQSGSITSQIASGSAITRTVDGTEVLNMESGISRLNTGINFQDRISSSITNHADTSLSFAKGSQVSWAENMLSSIRQMEDVGTTLNASVNSGDSYSLSSSSGFQKSATDYVSAIEKFAHDNGMSKQDAGRYLAGAYVNASAHVEFGSDKQLIGKVIQATTGTSGGAKISGGIKGEADRSWTTTDSENFQKAQEFINQNNLSETLDKAIRGVEEERYQTDNRSGSHVNEAIASSLDKAKQASFNFNKNYQESISYREAASIAKDNASMININANQDFIEYVSKQPLANSNSPMGTNQAETILRSDHQLRDLYAKDFIKQQTETYMERFKGDHNINESSVKSFNNLKRDYVQFTNKMVNDNIDNKNIVGNNNEALSLKNTFADKSIETKVKSDIAHHSQTISNMMEQHETKQKEFKNIINNKVKNNPELERPVNKILDLVEDN
ncbi:MAG: conjugal transfer protein TraG N-terminal domain-containing protein [Rickettsiaceae bacterium]|nr:conjugal transfer protein TraG N-terminal domain-containing protein [Rickettsiaceae bacterium]